MKKNCQDPNQGSLLTLLEDLRPKPNEFGSLNIDLAVRKTVRDAIKDSQLSRVTIAARMSELLQDEVTESMLNSWTAESREGVNRFPACYLPAFCNVVASIEPYRVLADLNGCFVIEGPEALDLEEKRIEDQEKKLAEKKRAIRAIKAMQGGRK